MAYERFANGGLSSLVAGIDNATTSLTVASAVGFPTGGTFRIVIDSEIMLVTSVQGQTFTVTRGAEGTTAASHLAAAGVFHVLTAGSLAQRDSDQFATGAIANCDAPGQAGRLYMPTEGLVSQDNGSFWDMMPYHRFTPPVSTNFTWINQGTSTVADTKGMMVLSPCSVASGDSLRVLVQTAPAPPYEFTVAMLVQNPLYAGSWQIGQFGICWRESASGKLLTFGWGSNNYPLNFSYAQWTNPTTLSASQFTVQAPLHHLFWIRFADDGTNRTVKVSGDGANFEQVCAPQSRTLFCTADQIGVFANSWKTANGIARIVSFIQWRQT
jgi:hypothetical protein